MFSSLSQFYTSQTWREFRRALIAERTSPVDGVLYSEYSGKPIANGYDVVLHHKKPLTLNNVNDFSISLNPENIQIVTHKEHNEIHERFGYCTERKVYYVYGSPCSGKTTFVRNAMGNSDIVLDMDNIWECLTGRRYHKPNALKMNAFEVRNAIYDMIKTRFPRQGWEKAWVIEGGANKVQREERIKTLGAEPIFIDVPKEVCLMRLDSLADRDKEQWKEYINEWFDMYQE